MDQSALRGVDHKWVRPFIGNNVRVYINTTTGGLETH